VADDDLAEQLSVSTKGTTGYDPFARGRLSEDCLAWTARTIVDAVTAPPNSDHRPPGNRSAT
jgi:hypothetical protein